MDSVQIGDKKFIVPEEVTYRQYHRLSQLLDDIDINSFRKKVGEGTGATIETDFNAIKNALFEGNKIPKLFAILLVPTGDIWKPKMEADHEDLFMDIGDVTAAKVIKDFLAGRGNLIEGIIDFFSDFLTKSPELNQNSKDLIKSESKITPPIKEKI